MCEGSHHQDCPRQAQPSEQGGQPCGENSAAKFCSTEHDQQWDEGDHVPGHVAELNFSKVLPQEWGEGFVDADRQTAPQKPVEGGREQRRTGPSHGQLRHWGQNRRSVLSVDVDPRHLLLPSLFLPSTRGIGFDDAG